MSNHIEIFVPVNPLFSKFCKVCCKEHSCNHKNKNYDNCSDFVLNDKIVLNDQIINMTDLSIESAIDYISKRENMPLRERLIFTGWFNKLESSLYYLYDAKLIDENMYKKIGCEIVKAYKILMPAYVFSGLRLFDIA